MAEFTFPCPACHQSIQCDEAWCGHQINCPMCQAQLTVPKKPSKQTNPLVPKPTGSGGAKLAAGATSVARPSFGANVPVRKTVEGPVKKKNAAIGYVAGGLILVAAIVLGYMYGWPYYKNWKEQRAAAEAAANAPATNAAPEAPPEPAIPTNLPPVPPVYTLDVEKAKIPDGKLNGKISGTNFVIDAARLDRTPTATILNIRQGAGITPDRGILVYMRMAPAEIPTNKTFTVSSTEKSTAITQVSKLWKTNPRYAATQKNYSSGYALKLEFGSMSEAGIIPVKMFLALPDPEQTVVAGIFTVSGTPPAPGTEVAPVQTTTPQDSEAQRAFQRRYGVRPGQR